MTVADELIFMGAPGSPYTRKMRALLRYRRIPNRMLIMGSKELASFPQPKVNLLPTFYFPETDGSIKAVVDSTPLIRRFEEAYTDRKVIPEDPVLAFFNYLFEDYGDEWLTKPMFHYRWANNKDAEKAAKILPRWGAIDADETVMQQSGQVFRERQTSRLYVVGSNAVTGPVIEASYQRFLKIMDSLLQDRPFLLGRRPSSGDFGLYGQLTQLALFDPTSSALTLQESPRTYAWTELLEDLSGLEVEESDWIDRSELESLRPLLIEIGRTYGPVMMANAKALIAGADTVECSVDGASWQQKPFPYQGKCVQWLQGEFLALSTEDQATVMEVVSNTGVDRLLEKL